jgi:gliding motility-associated lipoprotein GldH
MIEKTWSKDKELYFTYEIKDKTISYDVSIEIRNNNLYPFQNLWLFCAEEQPIGPVWRDTIECMLADDYGKWLGNGMSVHQLSIPVRTQYKFPHKGQYTFSIRQGMREDSLKGLEEIGLQIKKAKK